MDPERTFLRVHARATGMLSQLLTPRIRLTMEYVYLAIAVALFCLLVVMHTNFVQQPGCSEELAGIEFTEAQLVQIKIISAGLWTQNLDDKEVAGVHKQGSMTENSKLPDTNGEKMTTLTSRLWLYWISLGERSKLVFKPWKNDKEVIEPQTENVVDSSIMKVVSNEAEAQVRKGLHPSIPLSPKESYWGAIISFIHKWWIYLSSFWKDAEQFTINNSKLWVGSLNRSTNLIPVISLSTSNLHNSAETFFPLFWLIFHLVDDTNLSRPDSVQSKCSHWT